MIRVLTLLAVGLLAAVPTAASAETFTKTAQTFNVMTGPNGDQPCKIVGDVYKPNDATAADPAPAILATNGFGGSKDDFTSLGAAYASRGYVFLAYSGLGFGGSGCKITLDDPDWDGRAGSQLVTWLGTRDYVLHDAVDHAGHRRVDDPRLGMIGGSYGGQIQFAVAGLDPRVDALVPQITWNDLSYSLTPNNTDFTKGVTYNTPGVSKLDWPVLFFGLGVGQGIEHAFTDQDTSHAGVCPNFDDRVCTSLVQSGSTGYPDATTLALLRHASVASYIKNIRIPTFLAQGQSDTLFDEQEAVATWQALRAQNTPVKMLWRSAGHSGGDLKDQESSDTNLESAYESRMELEWFDYYLRGIGDAPLLDFTFLRDWALPKTGDAAPSVGETPSYPAGSDRTYYLSGGDALVTSRSSVAAGSAAMAATPSAPTSTGGGFTDIGAQDAPGTSVAFSTPALAEDTDVVGIPRVTVTLDAPTFAASQAADPLTHLVVFAKLYDVSPSGDLTLPRNLVSSARVADVGKPVTIELPGIAHRFVKGDAMRLVLSTSDAVYRANNFAGPVTVKVDAANPSAFTVPILGAQIGATGSGPSGTTRFAAADGAPAPQPAGLGAPRRAASAASLPKRSCVSRRSFKIHLRKGLRAVKVTVNGKRVKVAKRAATVNLRGLKKGTVRVVITGRSKKGKTVRSARTYKTCTAKRR